MSFISCGVEDQWAQWWWAAHPTCEEVIFHLSHAARGEVLECVLEGPRRRGAHCSCLCTLAQKLIPFLWVCKRWGTYFAQRKRVHAFRPLLIVRAVRARGEEKLNPKLFLPFSHFKRSDALQGPFYNRKNRKSFSTGGLVQWESAPHIGKNLNNYKNNFILSSNRLEICYLYRQNSSILINNLNLIFVNQHSFMKKFFFFNFCPLNRQLLLEIKYLFYLCKKTSIPKF